MRSANKVVFNTGVQYAKMIITIGVTLYSTRLVLAALGASDFGIYNLVAGVIAMLSFLNTSMTISTQRYLSFYLGSKEPGMLKMIFNSSVLLHLIIGLIVVLFLELGGIYLFDKVLSIPAERLQVAKTVFHFMVISTFFTINAVPYDAAINAHEDLFFDAITGILDALLKLGIAFWVLQTGYDKLVLFGVLTAGVTVIIRIIKSTFCIRKYDECKGSILKISNFNKKIFIEMFSFAGWNTLGAIMSVSRNQGIAIILNIFLGTIVNAAYGIANQVNAQVSSFSGNMLKALNPQIVKSEGEGNRKRMLRLAMSASKFSFYLLGIFAIPLIVEMPYVLKLWLKDVPEYTVVFCRLILVVSLITQLSNGLMVSIQSVGKIKMYTTVMSLLLLLNLPVAYFLMKKGFSPHYVLIVAIVLEGVALLCRIGFANTLTGLIPRQFFLHVIFPALGTILVTIAAASTVPMILHDASFLRLFITSLVSLILLPVTICLYGTTVDEKKQLRTLINTFSEKIMKRKLIFKADYK